jgi:hypothetical protein
MQAYTPTMQAPGRAPKENHRNFLRSNLLPVVIMQGKARSGLIEDWFTVRTFVLEPFKSLKPLADTALLSLTRALCDKVPLPRTGKSRAKERQRVGGHVSYWATGMEKWPGSMWGRGEAGCNMVR